MKLSIWQQFSSNHSANYSIVGRFPDNQTAQNAFKMLDKLVHEIHDWRRSNPDWVRKNQRGKTCPEPTPPEYRIANKYSIDWDCAIDWLHDDPQNNIAWYEQDVFIGVDFETWSPSQPIEDLFHAIGATGTTKQDNYADDLKVNLELTLPKEDYHQVYEQIKICLYACSQPGFRSYLYIPWRPSNAESGFEYNVTGEIEGNWRSRPVTLTCKLEFSRLHIGFPPMIEWLRDNGCTKIEYTFEPVNNTL